MAWLYLYLTLLSIRVTPRALLKNDSVRVICVVPQRAENRKLTIAVEGYRESEYELDGEKAPGVFQRTYDHVPCEVTTVSCVIGEETGRTIRAALPIQVSGCED